MKEKDFLLKQRKKIDYIDDKILKLIVNRFKIVNAIGKYKKENNILVIQSERINYIINKSRVIAINNKLDPNIFETIYRTIIDKACDVESEIIN